MRVVHLINQLGRGGSERQLCLLLRSFDRRRFTHTVVAFNPSRHQPWNRELEAAGVEVVAVPEGCRGVARRLFYLARRLRPCRPRVIHSWSVHDNPYAGALGRWLGAPCRWGSLRGSLSSPGLERLPAPVRFLLLRSVDRLVVNCRALEEELAGTGYPASRVAVLPSCVDLEEMEVEPADLADLGIEPEAPVVGSVGNLRRIKNHALFVRAMAEVLPRHPRARAVIVGQPLASEPEHPALIEAEIERLGLRGRVILTGFRSDVPRILKRLSVLCLTSESEGMPSAALEAMAAARPVVAVAVGGVPELVRHGWNGYLAEPGDAAGLAAAVDRLLADPYHAADLGSNARRLAEEGHDCGKAARRLAALYEAALEEHGR